MGKRAHVAQHAQLSMLAHGAGVQKNQIRPFLITRDLIPHLFEHAGDFFAVGNVLLAAVSVDHSAPPAAIETQKFFIQRADFIYISVLAGEFLRRNNPCLGFHSIPPTPPAQSTRRFDRFLLF